MPEPRITVYAGLSITRRDVSRILPRARCADPVVRGDIARDVAAGVGVIVIVDGRFMQHLSVSPGELMDALRCGTRVYGCSSMGALRAAELAPYGMIGHGRIFELVRETTDFSDDLLGLAFREDTLEALTVPYVDLHFALVDLERRGQVSRSQRDQLLVAFRALHFAERDREHLRERLVHDHGPRAQPLCRLADRALRLASQKRIDALATLARVKRDLADIDDINRRMNPGRGQR